MRVLALVVATAAAQPVVVELPENETLASVRLRAIGGAITGVAESASSHLYNPAAIALRRPQVEAARIDPDGTLQARNHPVLAELGRWALDQPPKAPPHRIAWWQAGGDLRVGRPSAAIHFRGHFWDDGSRKLGTGLWSLGGGVAGPTWSVGVLPHALAWQVEDRVSFGLGATVGGLWAPDGSPLRLGARARTPMRTGVIDGPGPNAARVPAEAAIGASWTFGAENVAGTWGPERVAHRDRGPVLLLASDFVFTGSSGVALPLVAVLERDATAPSPPTFAAHGGLEARLFQDRMRLRAGGGNVPGRGDAPAGPAGSFGLAGEIARSERGVGIRVTAVVETVPSGPSVGVGFESW